jgi:hypothetical protein
MFKINLLHTKDVLRVLNTKFENESGLILIINVYLFYIENVEKYIIIAHLFSL